MSMKNPMTPSGTEHAQYSFSRPNEIVVNFRLPSPCSWGLRPSGLLGDVGR